MKTLLLIAFLLISNFIFSQDETNTFYTRIRGAQPSLGFEHKINNSLSIGFEAGYRFRFTKEAFRPYGVIGATFQYYWMNRAYQGVVLRPIMLNFKTSERKTITLSTTYNFLKADNIINDVGKFGGSNQSEYEEYSQQHHEIGMSYLFSKSFRRMSRLSWYYELGLSALIYKREYTIKGSYSNQMPSNEIEESVGVGLYNHFGLKFDLYKK
jgi:hypothetical protein